VRAGPEATPHVRAMNNGSDHEEESMRVSTNDLKGSWLQALAAAAALAAVMVVAPAQPAAAADEKPKVTYTRVALWDVERAHWGDFVTMFESNEKAILEKLMADGHISEWGIDAEGLHHPEGYTHSTWYSAGSLGGLAKASEAFDAAWKAMGADKLKAIDTEFAAMIVKHRDYLLRTENLRSAAATLDGGYYHGHFIQVTRGKGSDFEGYFENRIKPVYESLMQQGVVVAYGMSAEEITTDHPMNHSIWYMVRDAAGLDAVKAAFDAVTDGMSEEERRARRASFMDLVEEDSYRENITSVIHWSSKAN
jgi:hypothetical protein